MQVNIRNTAEAQKVAITKTDTVENIKAKLPEGATLKSITLNITTAFDGGATLSVGVVSDKTKFVNVQILTSAAIIFKPQVYTAAKNGEAVYFKVNGTPTIGTCEALVEYYTKNEYTGSY